MPDKDSLDYARECLDNLEFSSKRLGDTVCRLLVQLIDPDPSQFRLYFDNLREELKYIETLGAAAVDALQPFEEKL